jgi:hypothetical protein
MLAFRRISGHLARPAALGFMAWVTWLPEVLEDRIMALLHELELPP